jgi:hypothetical protein
MNHSTLMPPGIVLPSPRVSHQLANLQIGEQLCANSNKLQKHQIAIYSWIVFRVDDGDREKRQDFTQQLENIKGSSWHVEDPRWLSRLIGSMWMSRVVYENLSIIFNFGLYLLEKSSRAYQYIST